MSKYDHIILPSSVLEDLKYAPRTQGGGNACIPVRDRCTHAQYLQNRFSSIWEERQIMISERTAVSLPNTKRYIY